MVKGRKHWCQSAACVAAVLCLTGCGNSIPDMTAEQAQQVGEYAAVTLLKYDANHRSRLVDVSVVEEQEAEMAEQAAEPTPQPEQGGMKPVENTPVIEAETAQNGIASLEEYYALPQGITLSYSTYTVSESYPQDNSTDAYFALDAAPGKKLLVLHFQLENRSGEEQTVNLFSKDANIRVTVNENYRRSALTTMLLNDMSTYMDTVPDGATQELVLLIEIEEDMAETINSVSLNLKNESNAYTIQLF